MIKTGETIGINELLFVYQKHYVDVFGALTHNRVAMFHTMNNDGLPTVRTRRDFEESVLWWLYDNGGL